MRNGSFWVMVVALAGFAGAAACGSDVSHEGGGGSGAGGTGGAGASAPVCVAPDAPQVFEIGTGEQCFERVADGGTVPLMNGPQGGYHLWLAVGCEGCAKDDVIQYDALDPVTLTSLAFGPSQTIIEPSGDWPQVAGIQLGMPGDEFGTPPLPEGTEVLVDVKVFDPSGMNVLHEGQTHWVLGPITPWDPCDLHPESPCCSEPCN